MNKELLQSIKKSNILYKDKLNEFFEYYENLINATVEKVKGMEGTEEHYMVSEMVKHLEKEGYIKLRTAVSSLNEDVEEKVLAMIKIYTRFFKIAETDILALVDQLLYIPEKFEIEFVKDSEV